MRSGKGRIKKRNKQVKNVHREGVGTVTLCWKDRVLWCCSCLFVVGLIWLASQDFRSNTLGDSQEQMEINKRYVNQF